MDADLRILGEAIRNARMRKGFTQEALAETLDITPIHLKNIESSRRKPSVPLLFQLMEVLDLSVDALVFPERAGAQVIHGGGLSAEEWEAVERLVDVMRRKNRGMDGTPALQNLRNASIIGPRTGKENETYE